MQNKKGKGKVKASTDLNEDIFRNWENPIVTAAPMEEFKKTKIKSVEPKLPITIQRRRKPRKKSKTKDVKDLKDKASETNIEESMNKKSLYKWYHRMKESGRFNF